MCKLSIILYFFVIIFPDIPSFWGVTWVMKGKKMNDNISFQPAEPKLCANWYGFFGIMATVNLCSKCYRDLRITKEQATSAKTTMDKLIDGFHVEMR
ncbi:Zinc finger A20 and AN1 domain-containing stress-associated protein 1 [Camellia lanceoleosa]|uniref:Zinc finger A20 and AN1 domain-containing stress-associated protein 1 n=1 Tax=Camellia lanceoleosa TaxID=1840588 RepID=A0ACC0GZC4_9ERIC|nr:Zinc finger A20 and AN1 domain-containing stress-associated protein 1 [Camellia lanceoleosa]